MLSASTSVPVSEFSPERVSSTSEFAEVTSEMLLASIRHFLARSVATDAGDDQRQLNPARVLEMIMARALCLQAAVSSTSGAAEPGEMAIPTSYRPVAAGGVLHRAGHQ